MVLIRMWNSFVQNEFVRTDFLLNALELVNEQTCPNVSVNWTNHGERETREIWIRMPYIWRYRDCYDSTDLDIILSIHKTDIVLAVIFRADTRVLCALGTCISVYVCVFLRLCVCGVLCCKRAWCRHKQW